MPIIKYDFGGESGTPITPAELPLTVEIPEVEIPIPSGLPSFPKTELGGELSFGVEVSYTCPGYPLCRNASGACTWNKKSEVISVEGYLPIPKISLDLLPLPKSIGPFGGGSIEVPPRSFQPFRCANYPARDPSR